LLPSLPSQRNKLYSSPVGTSLEDLPKEPKRQTDINTAPGSQLLEREIGNLFHDPSPSPEARAGNKQNMLVALGQGVSSTTTLKQTGEKKQIRKQRT